VENGAAFSTGDFAAKGPLTPALSRRERRLSTQAFSSIHSGTPVIGRRASPKGAPTASTIQNLRGFFLLRIRAAVAVRAA